MTFIDATVVNVALPALQADLHATITGRGDDTNAPKTALRSRHRRRLMDTSRMHPQ
jgi:hypothetical protein